MIGLVVVSEGGLAREFVAASERVLGRPQLQLEALVIDSDGPDERNRQRLSDAIAGVDSGDGVIVLTDMLGGTANNLALAMATRSTNIAVLGGINLRVLLKLAKVREHCSLSAAVATARDSARRHIKSSFDLMGR
jgi:mannose PTS system EIIA component